jgi:uncharacterized protein (TIGR03435 family)
VGAAGAPPLTPDAPSLLDVFRDDLGLKLVKERATFEQLAIDHVEPLIEN